MVQRKSENNKKFKITILKQYLTYKIRFIVLWFISPTVTLKRGYLKKFFV